MYSDNYIFCPDLFERFFASFRLSFSVLRSSLMQLLPICCSFFFLRRALWHGGGCPLSVLKEPKKTVWCWTLTGQINCNCLIAFFSSFRRVLLSFSQTGAQLFSASPLTLLLASVWLASLQGSVHCSLVPPGMNNPADSQWGHTGVRKASERARSIFLKPPCRLLSKVAPPDRQTVNKLKLEIQEERSRLIYYMTEKNMSLFGWSLITCGAS